MQEPIVSRDPRLGEVLTEAGRDGWIFVKIGRYRGTKRFNLAEDEARQLVRQLCEMDPSRVPDLGLGWKS